ncbi:MAG: repressor LexA [Ignavibacteriales bacterium CG07_land_8_20_14_0_80_59_12]|jgi:repressor LexA|nr:MAG: repressor LexA [Ignavibacteriales bacterium CG07_land_8_20_14_0_80_59_12]
MIEPTKRQRELLNFIKRFKKEKGYAPSMREIAEMFHITVGAVRDHLDALARKNLLRKEPNLSRSLHVLIPDERIPIYTAARGGNPRVVVDTEPKEYFDPHSTLGIRAGDKGIEVIGDSMVGAGIPEGSIVFFRPTAEVRDGHIVVARIEDGITVKTYTHEGRRVVLRPENPRYQPIVVNPSTDSFEILGRVVCTVTRLAKR